MFESIIFRHQRKFDEDSPINMDALYEALLFYGTVKVIADQSILRQLLDAFGHDVLVELVQTGFLRIDYLGSNIGIHTQNSETVNELHAPVIFTSPVLDLDNVAFKLFQASTGKQGKGRRLALKFMQNVSEANFGDNLSTQILDDLAGDDYVENAVKCVLSAFTPEYPDLSNVSFKVIRELNGLTVNSNINFKLINEIYHTRVPASHSSLSPALLLSHLFDTRADIHFASENLSEIATDPLSSAIIDIKYSELLKKREMSLDSLNSFQNFVDINTKNIGSVLTTGQRTPEEFLELLQKTKRMRTWLEGKDLETDLIKTYHDAVVNDTWADKLPAKTTRWSFFSGVGVILDVSGAGGLGTAAGVGISAIDSFLLDKMVRGWKPNKFISDVKKFSSEKF